MNTLNTFNTINVNQTPKLESTGVYSTYDIAVFCPLTGDNQVFVDNMSLYAADYIETSSKKKNTIGLFLNQIHENKTYTPTLSAADMLLNYLIASENNTNTDLMNILEGSFNYVNSMNQKIYADTYTQGIILSLDDKKARIYDIGNLSFLLLSPSNMKDGKYQINENTNNFLTYYQRHNQSNRRDMIGRANVSNNYINTIDFTPQSGDILFLFSSERRTMYNNLNQKKNVLGMLYYELFEKAENMSNEKKESFTPLNPNDLDGVMNFLRDACRKENTAFIAVKFK